MRSLLYKYSHQVHSWNYQLKIIIIKIFNKIGRILKNDIFDMSKKLEILRLVFIFKLIIYHKKKK